jgi:hypothetical protein
MHAVLFLFRRHGVLSRQCAITEQYAGSSAAVERGIDFTTAEDPC